MALTTKIKRITNAILKLVGIQLSTTRKERIEQVRLDKLVAKGHWSLPRYTAGLRFDCGKYLDFLWNVCYPLKTHYASFQKKAEDGGDGFFLENGWFESVDAEVLYCVIRHFQPRHIVEIGCGFSTRLMRRAIEEGRLKTRLTCIDPNPKVEIGSCADEIIKLPVEEVEPSKVIGSLAANDILFIDSSHTTMTGGDVPYLYLELLPRVKEGLLIHIHDIFFPFDYPPKFVVELHWGYTEQYLVHAFLCNNGTFEILWPARYMWEYRRSDVLETIPSVAANTLPSSLWLRKVR